MNKIFEISLFLEDPDIVTGIGVWTSSLNPKYINVLYKDLGENVK